MEMSRLELREGRFASGILASAAILWIGSLGCASLGPPKPQSDYRAQVEVRIGDASAAEIRVVRLVEYGREGKRRRDLTLDRPIVWIDRPDLRITWILDPAQKTFEELAIDAPAGGVESIPDPFGTRLRVRFRDLGPEVVDDVAVEKFAVEGNGVAGHAWLMPDGVPFRFRGRVGGDGSEVPVEIDYALTERDIQANHLFEIPANYAGYELRTQRSTARATRSEDIGQGQQSRNWDPRLPPPAPITPPGPLSY
jgi:hypothetical protein